MSEEYNEGREGRSTGEIWYEIVIRATNKQFLNFYDQLDRERILVELSNYDKAQHKHTGKAQFWLKPTHVRLLCWKIMHPEHFADKSKLEWFGGSGNGDQVEARVFRFEHDASGNFAAMPYRLSLQAGPGVRSSTGGISPKPGVEPTSRVSMRFGFDDILSIVLELDAFLNLKQERIVEVRRASQLEHFSKKTKTVQPSPSVRPPANVAPARQFVIPNLPIEYNGYPKGTPLDKLDRETLGQIAARSKTLELSSAAKMLLGQ